MLLHALLLVRYPLSQALRAWEFVRWFLELVLRGLEDPDYVAELKESGEALAKLDRWLSILEKLLHAIIGRLAAELLSLKFRAKRPSLGRMPAASHKPLAFPEVFARFQRLVRMLGSLEQLALRRAARIRREIEANPLRLLTAFASTSPAFAVEATCAELRDAAPAQWRGEPHCGERIASSCERDGGGRIRAPP